MKLKIRLFRFLNRFNSSKNLSLLLMLVGFLSYGQTFVSVNQDSNGAEPSTNASFTVNAFSFSNSGAVLVQYTVTGTATPGIDYSTLSGTILVTINGAGSNISVDVLDDLVDENNETVIITLTSSANYSISGSGTATRTIIDNDTAGVNVNTTTGTTTEAGGTAIFTFTLTSEPTDDVTIPINQYDGTETSGPSTVVLNASNWNTGVDLMVAGLDDSIVDGDIADLINTGNVTSGDTFYNALIGDDVSQLTVTNEDNDTAGVNVNTTTGTTTEAGGTTTFTFTLTSEPTDDVTIPINQYDGTETSGPTSVVLNASNWNTGVDLVVTGLNDNIIDGDIADEINTGNVTSGDSNYQALNANDVPQLTVTNQDNDVAGVNVSAISGNTGEDGTTATFTVTLDTQPADPVTIALSSNNTDEGTVLANVTIPVASWNTGIVVTATGVDDNVIDGNVGYTIVTGNVTSDDPNYAALGGGAVANVAVINTDDDTPGVNVTAISGNTSEDNAIASFDITLATQPTASVTIALSSSDTGEGTVQTQVTIPVGSWDTGVTVNVTGVDDAILDGDVNYNIVTGNVSSSDTDYNGLGGGTVADVSVVNEDNDAASISISDATANEDVATGNLVFNVVLDIAVAGGTTVSYTFSDGSATGGGVDYTGEVPPNNVLTFAGTAGEVETITVPINDDAILEQTEDFFVQLGIPSNGVTLSGGGDATGTINDDDNCTAAPILDTSVPTTFCDEFVFDDNTVVSFNDYTNSVAPSGFELTWSRSSNPLNTNAHLTLAEISPPTNDGSYYGFFYDDNGTPNNTSDDCASGVIEVELTLNDSPDIPVGVNNERCGPGTVLLTATTTSAGASLNWYDAIDSDTPVGTGESYTTPVLTATTSFFVEAVENNCPTERVEVIATVGFQATTGVATNASICSVPANGPTILDLDDRLSGQSAGVWAVTTDPSGGLTVGASNIIDFRDLAEGNYVFTYTTTGSTAPCDNISVDVTISLSDCDTDEDSDGLFGGDEAILGTDPNNEDTDGDGINDGIEVGPDTENPLDEDEDGIIDALDSNTLDTDSDGVNDQQDPANENPCIPDRFNGSCDTDGDGISDLDEQTNGSDPDDPCSPNATPDCDLPIDLGITKIIDNPDAVVGDTVVFTVTVTNLSDRRAVAIVVGELLDIGFELNSSTPSSGSYDTTSGEWTIQELLPAGMATLTVEALVVEGGPYTNTATLLESIPVDDTAANNEATVTLDITPPEGIDLVVEKTVDVRSPLLGEEITFTITVRNESSNGETLSNIVIEDILPTGIDSQFVYVSHLASDGVYDETTGLWQIASLDVSQEISLQITVSVPIEGFFANTATYISSSPRDSNSLNNQSTAEVRVSLPSSDESGFIFNQFSPNSDGTNDFLKINDVASFTGTAIQIFDRYGNLVFEDSNMTNDEIWDGTWKNNPSPQGTYYYLLNLGDGSEIRKGWIQLIR